MRRHSLGSALSALRPRAQRQGGQERNACVVSSRAQDPGSDPTVHILAAWNDCRRCAGLHHAGVAVGCWRQRGTRWGPGSCRGSRSGVKGATWWLPMAPHPGAPEALGSPPLPQPPTLHPGPQSPTHIPACLLALPSNHLPPLGASAPPETPVFLALPPALVVSTRWPASVLGAGRRGRSRGQSCVLGSYTQATDGPARVGKQKAPESREDSMHPLCWSGPVSLYPKC